MRTEELFKEPPFIKLYLDDLSRLNGLTSVQRTVLNIVMKYASYGNELVVTKKTRDIILKEGNIALGSFKNALSVLVQKELLYKGNKRSIYVINPLLAFKGRIGDRAKLIITYNELGEREAIKLEGEVK